MPGCAHNIPAQAAMVDAIDRAISATHPSTDARRTSTARSHTHSRTPVVQQAKRREFFCLFCQHAATALPRLPCHTPSCCALLYRGRALSMRPVQDAPRSRRPPGPPGRLRLHCVCVCVLCDVMFPCRLMCFLLSGRLPSAMRLLSRSVALAAVSLSPSVSVSGARVICCSPTPSCRGCALLMCCTVQCVRKSLCEFAFADACGLLSAVPPHHTTSIHHTPHHAISTHLIHHKPRIPTIFTTTHYHSFLSTQVWDGVQFTVCLGCTVCA